jgi:quercetin dioxygenase-like cupin family protein
MGKSMNYVTNLADHVGSKPDRFFKTTLFRSDHLLLGVNCLEPGQVQEPHDHANQDKFYYVAEGRGRFQIADEYTIAGPGEIVWAPAGVIHGVWNEGDSRLTLLVGIAPAP